MMWCIQCGVAGRQVLCRSFVCIPKLISERGSSRQTCNTTVVVEQVSKERHGRVRGIFVNVKMFFILLDEKIETNQFDFL